MPSPKLTVGIGAECSVLIKMLHPSKLVDETLINQDSTERLVGLIALKKEVRTVNRKEQSCIIFRHETFGDKEIYCCVRYCKVLKEGAAVDFFPDTDGRGTAEVEVVADSDEVEEGIILPDGYEFLQGNAEDLAMMEGMGFDVDDDNRPAPENVPGADDQVGGHSENGLYDGQSWGWSGICNRRSDASCSNTGPRLRGIDDVCLFGLSYTAMMLLFFPRLLVNLVINQTNKCLKAQNFKEI